MSIYESMRSAGHVIAAAVDRFFLISERGSTIQGEVRAGLTTFFTVSYVLVVCPQLQVDCGMDLMKTYAATALTSCVTSLVGGMATNMPYVFTPSVGLVGFI
jgi:AGZA family xanthine/uracil permease-like MFS transporter